MIYIVRLYDDYHNPNCHWFLDKERAVKFYNRMLKFYDNFDCQLFCYSSKTNTLTKEAA